MRDLSRRARKDSDTQLSTETPDFIFNYSDSDNLDEELAEWYTYSEEPEYLWNLKAFNDKYFKHNYENKKWSDLSRAEKKTHIIRLLDETDVNSKQNRDNICRSILYLAQGCFEECKTTEDYYKNLVENVAILFDCDTFSVFIDLLMFEINNLCTSFLLQNKYAPCISDNADLRVILSVLYTMLEVIRLYDVETASGRFTFGSQLDLKYANIKQQLRNELNKPLSKTNELFSIYLFQLINKFCNQNVIVLPIKKIILMLWKVLLFTLGGIEEAFKLKNEQRLKFNLQPIVENPSVIINHMSPATPPPNPIDLVNDLQFANPNSSYKRKKNGLTKQTKGIDNENDDLLMSAKSANSTALTIDTNSPEISNDMDNVSDLAESDSVLLLKQPLEFNDSNESVKLEVTATDIDILDSAAHQLNIDAEKSKPDIGVTTPYPVSTPFPVSQSPPSESADYAAKAKAAEEAASIAAAATADAALVKLQLYNQMKTLPWRPKVRQRELELFLDQERKKFLGFGDLNDDLETLIGLPYPIHESVRILKQHLYVSLADEQIKQEEKIIKYPMSYRKAHELINKSSGNDDDGEQEQQTPVEFLFSSILSNLPQYLICLLKILLTSVPQTRPKTDSLQIMSDLFPEDLLGSHFLTIKLGIDTNRHKEILIKAISAILLLMLKHFKVNHVYQFEFMSQHLLFANCVPLILKFFNLNISSFIQSKNSNTHLDFPNCVIGDQPELDAEELENGDSSMFRWRNVFSCINLLRILNKLTKYKRSRVMMLVIFKSAPILKKILRVKQSMLQLYALKLLKMQTRHLGRQWRKTNMSTMSAIYQKVRHRLNDDWAFGNEQETQAWDFQSDECTLRAKIDAYIQRCYKSNEETNLNLTQQQQQQQTNNPNNNTTNNSIGNNNNNNNNFDYTPTDNSPFSYLSKKVDLPENFENNYEQWLNEEVFSNKINWDCLLENTAGKSKPIILF